MLQFQNIISTHNAFLLFVWSVYVCSIHCPTKVQLDLLLPMVFSHWTSSVANHQDCVVNVLPIKAQVHCFNKVSWMSFSLQTPQHDGWHALSHALLLQWKFNSPLIIWVGLKKTKQNKNRTKQTKKPSPFNCLVMQLKCNNFTTNHFPNKIWQTSDFSHPHPLKNVDWHHQCYCLLLADPSLSPPTCAMI